MTSWYFCYCIWSLSILRNMKWVSKRSECDFVSKRVTKTFRNTNGSSGNYRNLNEVSGSHQQRSVVFEGRCPLAARCLAQKEHRGWTTSQQTGTTLQENAAQAIIPTTTPSTNTHFWEGRCSEDTRLKWHSFSAERGMCWQGSLEGKCSKQVAQNLQKSRMPTHSQRHWAKTDRYQRLERIQMFGINLHCKKGKLVEEEAEDTRSSPHFWKYRSGCIQRETISQNDLHSMFRNLRWGLKRIWGLCLHHLEWTFTFYKEKKLYSSDVTPLRQVTNKIYLTKEEKLSHKSTVFLAPKWLQSAFKTLFQADACFTIC